MVEQPSARPTWSDRAREWFALLATAALSCMAAGVALILWLGRWSVTTEAQRIGFLGASLMLLVGLVGLGASWLWRMQYKTLEVKAGLVQVSLTAQVPAA